MARRGSLAYSMELGLYILTLLCMTQGLRHSHMGSVGV